MTNDTTGERAPLLIDEQGGVAWLTMNRPERLNALNRCLTDALPVSYTHLTLPTNREV